MLVICFTSKEKQFRQHFGLKSPSVLAVLCNNHLLQPSSLDAAFTQWKKGLVSFCDLDFDETFGSFENLFTKFDAPNHDLFRYFQLHNFARTQFISFPKLPENREYNVSPRITKYYFINRQCSLFSINCSFMAKGHVRKRTGAQAAQNMVEGCTT